MNIKKLVSSFKNAFVGLSYAIRKEQNFRIELFFAAFVVGLMFVFPVERWEVVILTMVIAIVLMLELVNTLLEQLVDFLKPKIDMRARILKDLMAATVFVASLLAVAIGIIIFFPYLSLLFL